MHRFADDLLNALTAQIALLDARGVIVAVNDAWRRFAEENGGNPAAVGRSYFEICEEANHASSEPEVAALLAGLRALVGGERTRFSIEYPWRSTNGERWFILEATRFISRDGQTFFVTAHHDISGRKQIEEELVETHSAVGALNRELQLVLAREQVKARTDHLTGLYNRGHFFELTSQLFNVAQRYRTPLSIVMFDIDDFKRINDGHGHHAGDAVLRRVARIAREHTRDSDVLARYGGEEFIVARPNTGARDALVAAENIREHIAECRENVGELALNVTISMGVAEIVPRDETLDRLIARADHALYVAKGAGRNCSRIFSPA